MSTIAEAKAELSEFVAVMLDPDVAREVSRLTAVYIAAIVREERRAADLRQQKAIDALVAAHKAAKLADPYGIRDSIFEKMQQR